MSTSPRPFIVRFVANGEACRIVCRPAERHVIRGGDDGRPAVPSHWAHWANSGQPAPGMNTYVTDVVIERRSVDALGAEQWVPHESRAVTAAILAAVLGQLGVEAGASEIDLGNLVC